MNHLIVNLLKAFGLVAAGYILLFAGVWAMLSPQMGTAALINAAITGSPVLVASTIPFLLLTVFALNAPPKNRPLAMMRMTIGALSLIAFCWAYIFIRSGDIPTF